MKTIQIKKYGIRHTSPTFCNAGGVSVFPYGEENDIARISIFSLNALRTFFEDNISTTEMLEVIDKEEKLFMFEENMSNASFVCALHEYLEFMNHLKLNYKRKK